MSGHDGVSQPTLEVLEDMPVLFDTLEKETSSVQGYVHQTLLSDVPGELWKERPCGQYRRRYTDHIA